MGPMGWPERSVRNYHYTLCNDPEEHKSCVKSHWQEMADKFTTLMFSNTKGAESSNWALSLVCSMEMVKCHVLGNGSTLEIRFRVG